MVQVGVVEGVEYVSGAIQFFQKYVVEHLDIKVPS
jgi:hypothetical protein